MSIPLPESLRRSRRNDTGDDRGEPSLPPAANPDEYSPIRQTRQLIAEDRDSHGTLAHLTAVLQDRLCEIAHLLVKLTYVDMITLSKGISADPATIAEWARQYIDNSHKETSK